MLGFDAGHGDGANTYKDYSEGTTMRKLGVALESRFLRAGQTVFLTRTEKADISLLARAQRAQAAGVKTLISIHTNWPHDGVLVFHSVNKPQNRELAMQIGQAIADAMEIKLRDVRTRLSEHTLHGQPQDWYGIIRNSEARGIDTFIVEHGNHIEFSKDIQGNIQKVVDTYVKIFNEKGGGKVSIGTFMYTIKGGDTLGGIAQKYNTTWQTLQTLNKLSNPSLIRPGQIIQIPNTVDTAPASTSAEVDTLKKEVVYLKKLNKKYQDYFSLQNELKDF